MGRSSVKTHGHLFLHHMSTSPAGIAFCSQHKALVTGMLQSGPSLLSNEGHHVEICLQWSVAQSGQIDIKSLYHMST